jgi:hypothetical protein
MTAFSVAIRTVVAAVDPASLGAVAAGNTDITIAGVKPGDVVIGIPPATLEAGLALQGCTVPAADTVRVRITNASAGVIDGASLNWTFVILLADQAWK